MAKDIPKVPFTKADLYGLVNRDLSALKPQQQGPVDPRLQALSNIRMAIQTRKLGIGGRPKAL
jgi:hypothetical protein